MFEPGLSGQGESLRQPGTQKPLGRAKGQGSIGKKHRLMKRERTGQLVFCGTAERNQPMTCPMTVNRHIASKKWPCPCGKAPAT